MGLRARARARPPNGARTGRAVRPKWGRDKDKNRIAGPKTLPTLPVRNARTPTQELHSSSLELRDIMSSPTTDRVLGPAGREPPSAAAGGTVVCRPLSRPGNRYVEGAPRVAVVVIRGRAGRPSCDRIHRTSASAAFFFFFLERGALRVWPGQCAVNERRSPKAAPVARGEGAWGVQKVPARTGKFSSFPRCQALITEMRGEPRPCAEGAMR
jgi:hypothetical protein